MEIEVLYWLILSFGIAIITIMLLPHLITITKFIMIKSYYSTLGSSSKMRLVHQINEAVTELAAGKVGAIITIANKDKLDNLRTDGIIIDSKISSQLIITLFNKHSPLHDGAIIIEGERIKYAATFFKITEKSVSNKYGARHRAALGVSERSDSLTIVVSEETGKVSFTKRGEIRNVAISNLQEELTKSLK